MKILFLTDGIYPFQLGGMQKHSTILSTLLAKNDCRVDVVHCGGEGYSSEEFVKLYESKGALGVREWFLPFSKSDSLPGHYIRENKIYSKNAYLLLTDKLDTYDIIYAQGFTGWHFVKERQKGNVNTPVFVNLHGFGMFQQSPTIKMWLQNILLRRAVSTLINKADYVYSFGGEISKIIRNQGVSPKKILLQTNGIEGSWLVKPKKTSVKRAFLFIGRYERGKGVAELTAALKALLDCDAVSEFHFVGPIPEKLRLPSQKINYHGEVRDVSELKKVIDKCDCLICPSYYEGMPTVILEAMARGLAIIATKVGAVERQVEENGLLLDHPDVVLIRNAMMEITQMNSADLDKMKSRSIELIREKFLWEAVVKQKIEDFQKVLREIEQ